MHVKRASGKRIAAARNAHTLMRGKLKQLINTIVSAFRCGSVVVPFPFQWMWHFQWKQLNEWRKQANKHEEKIKWIHWTSFASTVNGYTHPSAFTFISMKSSSVAITSAAGDVCAVCEYVTVFIVYSSSSFELISISSRLLHSACPGQWPHELIGAFQFQYRWIVLLAASAVSLNGWQWMKSELHASLRMLLQSACCNCHLDAGAGCAKKALCKLREPKVEQNEIENVFFLLAFFPSSSVDCDGSTDDDNNVRCAAQSLSR